MTNSDYGIAKSIADSTQFRALLEVAAAMVVGCLACLAVSLIV